MYALFRFRVSDGVTIPKKASNNYDRLDKKGGKEGNESQFEKYYSNETKKRMRKNLESIEEIAFERAKRTNKKAERKEVQSQMNTLAYLNNIVRVMRESDICPEMMEALKDETSYIGKKMSLSPIQSILLAVIAEQAGPSGMADSGDITRFLGITNLEFMNFIRDIEEMSSKHIIRIVSNGKHHGDGYMVYREAMEAIKNDREYVAPSYEGLTVEGVFTQLRILFSEYFDDALTTERLNEEITDIICKNQQILFCQKAKAVLETVNDDDYFNIFMYLCHRYASHGQVNIEIERLLMLLNVSRDQKKHERDFAKEHTPLQESGLIEFSSHDGFVNEEQVCLCEDIRKDYFTELDIKAEEIPRSPDLKSCSSISKKELVYNPTEKEQMRRITRMLDDANFKDVQKRMKEQGLREGINLIFYGAPGTGKTESCLQLARETGRDILMVDVSKLKDKYVGNSEKQVRGLFRYYRDLVNHSEKAPILLFNEADAIFGKRITNVEQSVDKMNNTLQNIILQEMETISGILIATTNLETSLDPAFERRFLMKVRFDMPDAGARQRIWKNMLPELSETGAETLAQKYEFSGGQIENITRKSMINYIIEGEKTSMEDLMRYCEEECFIKKESRKTIGFE